MRESTICFGDRGGLFGICSEPLTSAGEDVPAVLLLTAGLVHRSGPFRLHVEVARRLADCGYSCCRFDQAGIGDSAARSENLSDQEGAARDVQIAMDELQTRFGTRRFVLFGLCSGADNSHVVATRDRRVVGVVALDAFAYPTFRYYLRRYARFLRNPRHVYRSGIAKLQSSPPDSMTCFDDANGRGGANGRVPRVFEREFPPQAQIGSEIQSLAARGMKGLYIYSGGYTWYNYSGQFYDNFPSVRGSRQIEIEYFPQADHTYFFVEDRQRLVDRVERWMMAHFPIGDQSDARVRTANVGKQFV